MRRIRSSSSFLDMQSSRATQKTRRRTGPLRIAHGWLLGITLLALLVRHFALAQTISGEALEEEYDFVVVGAGVAGGVLATRLAQYAEHGETVLVLETGMDESKNPLLQPSYFFKDTKFTHLYRNYFSQEGPNVNNRRILHMNAKALGGGSAINAMVWTWGDHRDWPLWTAAAGGLPGWTFADVMPYFQRVETWELGDRSGLRGREGPVHVSMYAPNNMSRAAVESASRVLGVPMLFDNNGDVHEGAAVLQRNVRGTEPMRAERQSSWVSYLQAGEHVLPNLHIQTQATVTRVEFAPSSASATDADLQPHAVAVEFLLNGRCTRVTARREIILSAGAHNTPKILLLSGVGNGTELTALGLETVLEQPGVGKNMVDHINPGSLIYFGPPRMDYDGNLVAAYGRTGVAPEETTPDVEYGYIMGPANLDPASWPYVPSIHMFYCLMLNNDARGSVRLFSRDPLQDPVIESGFFKTQKDQKRVVRIFRQLLDWAKDMNDVLPLTQATSGPYPVHVTAASTDDEILAEVRNTVDTHWHVAATARMGPATDPTAVVDEHFRVHGVKGLRVVDASAMPIMPNGHPMAALMMMGERAAEWVARGI